MTREIIEVEESSFNAEEKTKFKKKFHITDFEQEVEEANDLSKIRVIISPLEGRLSMGREEDVLFQLKLTPVCEEVTLEGKTISVNFIKGLKDLQYCAVKKIRIKTMAHEDDFILVNGNIKIKTNGNSETMELENAFFWSESEANHTANLIDKATLKRVKYLKDNLVGAEDFLEKKIHKGIA